MACWPAIRCCLACLLALGACGCERGFHVIFGFIDHDGEWVVEPAFEELAPMSESLAAAQQGGRWGFVDAQGSWTIEPRYEEVRSFSEGLAAVRRGDTWSFVDRSGETVITGPFGDANSFEGGMAAVRTDAGWGFVDHRGEFVIPPQFEELLAESEFDGTFGSLSCFSEGLCAARVESGWGYIDRAGRWVVPPSFDEAGWFREGLAAVRERTADGPGDVGFIGRSGEWVIEPRFQDSLWFSGGRAIAFLTEPGGADGSDAPVRAEPEQPSAAQGPPARAVMIDVAGRELAVVGWEAFGDVAGEVGDVLMAVAPDYLGEGLVPAERDGAWGFMDRNGRWVIEPRFGLVMPFRNGVAAAAEAQEDEEALLSTAAWGLIDATGRWTVAPELQNLGRYGDAHVMARRRDRWGLMNRDGTWRITPRFAQRDEWLDLAIPGLEPGFNEGLQRAATFANHGWTVVDARGRKLDAGTFEWLESVGLGRPDAPALNQILDQGLWGMTDRRLRALLPPELDEEPTPSGGYLEAAHDGRVGCMDSRARWVVPAMFDELVSCSDGPVIGFVDGKWGVWTPGAGWILPPGDYASAAEPWAGTFALESADGWRLYRREERTGRLEPLPGGPYEALDVSISGLVVVARSGRSALITEDHPVAETFAYDETDDHYIGPPAGGGRWLVKVRRGERWGLVDASGRERVPVRFDDIGPGSDELLAVRAGENWSIVDLAGREVFAPRPVELRPLTRRVAAFRSGEAWGLVNREGKVLVEPQYGEIRKDEGGLRVWLGGGPYPDRSGKTGRVGVLDARGRTVVEARFEALEPFGKRYWLAKDEAGWSVLERVSGKRLRDLPGVVKVEAQTEGRAAVRYEVQTEGGPGFGYVDERGVAVIPPLFDEAGPFREGIAVVRRGGKCGVIDRDGQELLPIAYDHCNRLADGRVAAGAEAPFDRGKWARSSQAPRPATGR